MTNKEVIERLRSIRVYDVYPKVASEETKQALELAIQALEETPQGEWEFGRVADNDLDEIIRCSVCHRFDTAKYIDGRNPYYDYPAFCKRCGASMKKGVWK